MAEDRSFDVLDYLVILAKWKKLLLILFFSVLIISYVIIYLFIDEQFESKALIIPAEESSVLGLSGIAKDLKNLPFGLGGSSKSGQTDLYITILYSRTTLEHLIQKFNLMEDYKIESREKAIDALKENIIAGLTDEDAFELKFTASSPEKASEMVNYLVSYINRRVIDLNVSKSRANREFIANRYEEITSRLRIAEDSLQEYQESSGLFEAEGQLRLMMGAYTELETGLIEKQLELAYLENTLSEDSPILNNFKTQVDLYKKELEEMRDKGKDNSVFLSYKSLPEKAKNYLRHYRDVEIYHTILEFITPLYEQAKFEEQKNIPVMQVIDHGNVPEKKSYPPRVLFALLASFFVTTSVTLFIIVSELIKQSPNPKIHQIKELLISRK